MTDLSELLAKLEAAEGPSRELDADIAVEIVGFFRAPAKYEQDDFDYCYKDKDGTVICPGHGGDQLVPLYTASLDAIAALVEASLPPLKHFSDQPSEGWKFGVYRLVLPGSWTAWIRKHGEDGVDAKARTPALALCIALVKAKQAEASL